MLENLTDLKKKYNALSERVRKAEIYLDDPIRTEAELDKWMPVFKQTIAELIKTLEQIGPHTATEELFGFTEVE